MADKLMYIPNDLHKTVHYTKCLKRLDTRLIEPTNQNLTILLLSERIRKRYYKTLATNVTKSPLLDERTDQ